MGAKLSKPLNESEALWSSNEIAEAIEGKETSDFSVNNIQIDSRSIEKGDLFVALKAERDGHDFVAMALEKGASGALVSNASSAPNGANLIVCEDTFMALESLGVASRRRATKTKRLAITGSVGKTTVKELTAAALEPSGKTHRSIKSFNNHFGVPLTLSRMPIDARFGVFEIGMNHAGEISRLVPQVKPHVAAITTVAPVHIEHFGSIEAIADAKAEIFLGIEKGGSVIIPSDNIMTKRLLKRAADIDDIRAITFGNSDDADSKIISVTNDGALRHVCAEILGEKIEWKLSEPGEHWVSNSLCALTLAYIAGAEIEAAADVISNFGALAGRGAVSKISLKDGSFTLVDEAYNANPTSVGGALDALKARNGKRKIAILGDMLELGEKENEYHAGLVDAIIAAKTDLVFLAGTRMKHLWDVLPNEVKGGYAETSKELLEIVITQVQKDDCIMVKGSNGSRMNVIVDALLKIEK